MRDEDIVAPSRCRPEQARVNMAVQPRATRLAMAHKYSMNRHNVALRAQLPPYFTSFYRLFLRATSAAVLHHPKSTRALRRVWRPTFHDAAEIIHKLQSCSQTSLEREDMKSWLRLWDARSVYFVEVIIGPGLS
jgi:hypothetical protein